MVLFTYSPEGHVSSVRDAHGHVTGYEHDGAGRVVRQVLPDGGETHVTYDADGNVASVAPPGRPAHVSSYTPGDLEESYTPPPAGPGSTVTRFVYDLDGNLIGEARPDAQDLAFQYDSTGRLERIGTSRGHYAFSYDAVAGRLTSVTAPGGESITVAHDGRIPLGSTWAGSVVGSVVQAYDNDLRVVSRSVNGGSPVTFAHDRDGLLTRAGALQLVRDAGNGLVTGTTLGGVVDVRGHDPFGQSTGYRAEYGGSVLYDVQYTFGEHRRITAKIETLAGVAVTTGYAYDAAGRLAEVFLDGAAIARYTYDVNGNRLSRTTPAGTVTGTYDDQDRLLQYGSTTYTYRPTGELVSRTAGGQITTYDYDALGNLRGITLPDGTTIEYVVDGHHRRIGSRTNGTLTRGWLYGTPLNPVAELDGSGGVVSRFVYATQGHVPDYVERGGRAYRIVSDHLGSVRLVVDTVTGAVLQRMDYDEFGRVVLDTNPGFQPFGFAGGLYDSRTGLTRFGARDYDAETGRWTAKDPLRFEGGLNLYAYVGNDPMNRIDPEGTQPPIPGLPPLRPDFPLRELVQIAQNPDTGQRIQAIKDLVQQGRLAASEKTLASRVVTIVRALLQSGALRCIAGLFVVVPEALERMFQEMACESAEGLRNPRCQSGQHL
jgi:RHS repeat-associated protein